MILGTKLYIKEATAAYSKILTSMYLRMDLSLEDWIWVETLSNLAVKHRIWVGSIKANEAAIKGKPNHTKN